jgi:hypothetical protein
MSVLSQPIDHHVLLTQSKPHSIIFTSNIYKNPNWNTRNPITKSCDTTMHLNLNQITPCINFSYTQNIQTQFLRFTTRNKKISTKYDWNWNSPQSMLYCINRIRDRPRNKITLDWQTFTKHSNIIIETFL